MKRIINSRKYDTETAKLVGSWSNGFGYGDFDCCFEDLYRKRTGEFFIHGKGGARSKYAVSCGQNSWSGGEDITPLTEEKAKQWAEDCLSADDYEKIFGTVDEGGPALTSFSDDDLASELERRGYEVKLFKKHTYPKLPNGWYYLICPECDHYYSDCHYCGAQGCEVADPSEAGDCYSFVPYSDGLAEVIPYRIETCSGDTYHIWHDSHTDASFANLEKIRRLFGSDAVLSKAADDDTDHDIDVLVDGCRWEPKQKQES